MALTTQHGSMCKPYGSSNTGGIFSGINGVSNSNSFGAGVICPVVRTIAAPASGFSVWVDLTAGSGTPSCSLYSYSFTGSYIGAVSFSGAGSRLVTLPAAQVPSYSSQSVYCYLPPGARVFDIEPVQ